MRVGDFLPPAEKPRAKCCMRASKSYDTWGYSWPAVLERSELSDAAARLRENAPSSMTGFTLPNPFRLASNGRCSRVLELQPVRRPDR